MAIKSVSEVYPRLYHYTTLEGAWGIIESRSLWATHVKFLNDFSETTMFRDPLSLFLLPHVINQYEALIRKNPESRAAIEKGGGVRAAAQHDSTAMVDLLYNVVGEEIYTASFCGEHRDEYINDNGLLSQWRGYGGDGGVALVFNAGALETLLEREGATFDGLGSIADVIYSDDAHKFEVELSAPLSRIANYVAKIFENMRDGAEREIDPETAFQDFITCVARYKHRGFKEENEVRIIAQPDCHDQQYMRAAQALDVMMKGEKKRRYRRVNQQIIPYICLFEDVREPLPIEKVIVGPHRDKEARAAMFRTLIRNRDVRIAISDIPFVTR